MTLSTHSPKMNYLEKKKTKRNMETFVKIGFAKISLAAQKSELPKFASVKFVITETVCNLYHY